VIKMPENNNKAKLEGWRDALQWVITQFFDHDHQMAMGEFRHAALELLNAKLQWVNSHDYFKDEPHHEPAK